MQNGSRRLVWMSALSLAWGASGVNAGETAPTADWVVAAEHGMVASDSPEASAAGVEILRAGGNAIDAAVATGIALGVTRPYSTGLGGGGFLMVRLAKTGEVYILDYRETAPLGARPDMYVKAREAHPDAPPPSRYGGLAVGVPGLLAGHATLLERFGTRSLRDVLAPALRLAREGFPVDQNYCSGSRDLGAAVRKYPSLEPGAQAMQDLFLLKGAELKPGAVLRQPDMARTLEILCKEGANAFYRGAIGEAIVRTVRRHGGIMTMEDLGGYRPVWREPIRVNYRGREVVLMPPASSGGICIAQTLQILEQWDLGRIRRDDPGLAAHLTIEALKHAFADRARYHGDADHVEVPVKKLTSREYARELASRIREDAVQPVNSYGWTVGDDDGTSHYSIVDAEGNVVAATETINTVYGALLMAEGTGIVLNNEMDDFTAEPGKVNAYGLRQSTQNAVAPGKRPLSCMSPTIVVDKGRPLLSVGASGGPRIITATLQVLLNVLDYELPLEQAVGGPRFHHQWQPDTVNRNAYAADDPVIRGLTRRGHVISDVRRDAVVQAIRIEPGRLTGASDPRKGGRPAGY